MSTFVLALVLGTAAAMLFLQGQAGVIAGFEPGEVAALAAVIGLVFFLVSAIVGVFRGRFGQALRDVFCWTAIAGTIYFGFTYREEVAWVGRRLANDFLSQQTDVTTTDQRLDTVRAVRIPRRSDGHFVARVRVNGQTVNMLVDTGASTVVLNQADARRIGINLQTLKYTVPVQTANGTTFAAPVRLKMVNVESIAVERVDALVTQPGALRESLLGMTFLSRLKSYEFAGEHLTFRI